MAIGEFGGAAAAPAGLAAQRSGSSARCMRRRPTGSTRWAMPRSIRRAPSPMPRGCSSRTPPIPGRTPNSARPSPPRCELFERSTRRYGKPEWNITSTLVGAERVPVHIVVGLGAAVLPAPAFRARVRASAAAAAAAAAHRRADVGPLRDAAARHGRRLPAQSRRLHHRMGRRARGAAVAGRLRSRRLHRLPHLDAALPRRRRARRSRCASRRCRCWPRSRAWRRTATRMCRIPWC